jgi:hypothetical protein
MFSKPYYSQNASSIAFNTARLRRSFRSCWNFTVFIASDSSVFMKRSAGSTLKASAKRFSLSTEGKTFEFFYISHKIFLQMVSLKCHFWKKLQVFNNETRYFRKSKGNSCKNDSI